MIMAVVMVPDAPGFRAIPSKALRMPRDCDKAPPMAAIDRPKAVLAAAIPKYRSSASDFFATSAASAIELNVRSSTTTAKPHHTSFLRIQFPPFFRFSRHHLGVDRLMMLLFCTGDVDHRQEHEHEALDEAHEDPLKNNDQRRDNRD